jgi:hypothetical protein
MSGRQTDLLLYIVLWQLVACAMYFWTTRKGDPGGSRFIAFLQSEFFGALWPLLLSLIAKGCQESP